MGDLFDSPVFSADRVHRYTLPRVVNLDTEREGESERCVAFIMLNPSTADETKDDPTIRRCMGFARTWGYDYLLVGNLFAFRATDPRDMKLASDPVGPENDRWLLEIANAADLVVCAWGQHGHYQERAASVTWALRKHVALHAIELAKDGTPKHPLYLKAAREPFLWKAKRPQGPTTFGELGVDRG